MTDRLTAHFRPTAIVLFVLTSQAAVAVPGSVNPVPAPGHPPGPVANAICASNYVARCPDMECQTGGGTPMCFKVSVVIRGVPVTIEICLNRPGSSVRFVSNQANATRCVSGYPGQTCLSHFQECGQFVFYSGPSCTGSVVKVVSGWQPACYSPTPVPLPVPLPFPPPPRTTAYGAVVPDEDPSSSDPNVAVPLGEPGVESGARSRIDRSVAAPSAPISVYTVIENPVAPSRDPIGTEPSTGYPWPDQRSEPTGEQ